jgi:hypothetical protein
MLNLSYVSVELAAPGQRSRIDDAAVVEIAREQYFELVSGALLSILRIFGARLQSDGKFDPAGL